MLPGCAEEAMETMERKFVHFWECGIFGLPGRYTGRSQKQCVSKPEIRHGSCQPGAVFTVPFLDPSLFCDQSQWQVSRWAVLVPGWSFRLCVWPGLPQVSPLFFLFVPTEGGAMCGNRLV